MKITLNTSDIAGSLYADDNASWSWIGAKAMAEYLEELEEQTGEELELDVVAIRCDFAEWESLSDWAHDYFSNAWEELGLDESAETEEFEAAARAYIEDHGQLVEFSGGVIVSSF